MRISLRTKLTSILAVPVLALVAVAARGVQHASADGHRSRVTADRIELSVAATTAASELARERALSATKLDQPPPAAPVTDDPDDATADDDDDSSGESTTTSALTSTTSTPPTTDATTAARQAELTHQRALTSHAVDALRARISRRGEAANLGSAPALDQLGRLGAAREAVDTGDRSANDVLGAYSEIIDPVLDLDQAVAGAGTAAMVGQLDAFQALSRALQDMVVERSLLHSAYARGTIDLATYNHLVDAVASQRIWLDLFERHAGATELARYSKALALPATTTVQQMQDAAVAAGAGGAVQGDASAWGRAMDDKIDALDEISDDTARALAQNASSQRAAAGASRGRALLLLLASLLFGGILLGLLQLFVLRPIGRIRAAADRAAHVALPAAIEAAHDQGPAAGRRLLAPLPDAGDRDLAALSQAFNSVQSTALALATDEADLRSKVNAVFVNFGRRTQDLVTRQLGHIDELETRTEDPDMLSDLFTLDHLATRLRRNAESLMVMAGAASPRPWSRPVSVVNVVRAAVAESMDYSRVDVEGVAQGAIAGIAANDVSHLLAELIDNALAFSPSEARVRMAGGWVESGQYLVTVSDAGAGMSTGQLAEANERISGSNVSDPGMSRYFGMYVVGRFARRHGIDVQLVPSRSSGATAEILLPDELMVGALAECQTTPGR